MAFVYTNKGLSERETKKAIPFTITKITRTTNKIPRKKFNQGGKSPVLRKL